MMASVLKQIFAEGGTKAGGRAQGFMPFGQGEDLTWWRPLIIPFRPLVIIFNLLIKSRGGGGVLSGFSRPRPIQTNEQMYEITWDAHDRPVKVVVHRQVNAI